MFLISNSMSIVFRNVIDFCILTWYPVTLLQLNYFQESFCLILSGFLPRQYVIYKQRQFYFFLPISIPSVFFLTELAETSKMIKNKWWEDGLSLFLISAGEIWILTATLAVVCGWSLSSWGSSHHSQLAERFFFSLRMEGKCQMPFLNLLTQSWDVSFLAC